MRITQRLVMASAVLASIGITGMMQNKHISKTAMTEHKSVQKATVQHNTFFSKVSADTLVQQRGNFRQVLPEQQLRE